jgi:ubiquinone/menaquinone biosynthesis C-methylase UbiE
MEQEPKKFPGKVKTYLPSGLESEDWQDSIETKDDAGLIFRMFQRILKEHGLDLTKNLKVLEVGSGNSVFLDFLKKQEVDVVGTDVDFRGEHESPQVVARIEQLPFKDESFDVVLSSAIFDNSVYEQDQALMIKEIVRVLKHGGFYLGNNEWRRHVQPIKGFDLISDEPATVYKKS